MRILLRAALAVLLLSPWTSSAAQVSMRTYNPAAQRRVGFIDTNGDEIVEEVKRGGLSPYIAARTFNEDVAAVQLADSTWTWIGGNGKRLNDKRYAKVSDFYEGFGFGEGTADGSPTVAVDRNGRERVLEGRVTVPRRSKFALYHAADAAGKTRIGYMAPDGTRITPPIFEHAGSFRNGRAFARVEAGGALSMVDAKGKVITGSGMFSESLPFLVDNRAPVRATASGLYGYVDSLGAFAIAPAFEEAALFAGKRSAVKLPGAKGWMVIDEKGDDVLKELFVDAPVFFYGHARVTAVGSDTTKVIEDDGDVTKSYTRNTREIGSNHLMSGLDKNGRNAYFNSSGAERIPYSRFVNRNLAQIGNTFVEGFAAVYYRDASQTVASTADGDGVNADGSCKAGFVPSVYGGCVKSQMRQMGGGEPETVRGAGPRGMAVTATNTEGLRKFMWYELRRTMALPMGGGSRNYAVYYGIVWAPMGTGVQVLGDAFAERPRQTMMPTIRTDAVEITGDLSIDKVLISRNRADFKVGRRNGTEVIEDALSYHALGELVLKKAP